VQRIGAPLTSSRGDVLTGWFDWPIISTPTIQDVASGHCRTGTRTHSVRTPRRTSGPPAVSDLRRSRNPRRHAHRLRAVPAVSRVLPRVEHSEAGGTGARSLVGPAWRVLPWHRRCSGGGAAPDELSGGPRSRSSPVNVETACLNGPDQYFVGRDRLPPTRSTHTPSTCARD